jgi:transposase/transcriptional regulator with XRE-family HTH domain
MSFNFVPVDRAQQFLLPPSVDDWLPKNHLAWLVIDVVDELDLAQFLQAYRDDGRGGAAYHPSMMVGLLVYAYAIGERSSRGIERRCIEDIAFRVITGNQAPDHATIARFRATHEAAFAVIFGHVLALCHRAGLVQAGVVAIDGTRLGANASKDANRTAEQLAAEILAEAADTDAREDADLGTRRGDELPEQLAGPDRKARLRALLGELEREAEERSYERQVARRQEIEAQTGQRMRGRKPKPDSPIRQSRRFANTTDPDSRLQKTRSGHIQGYNAQVVAGAGHVILAAKVVSSPNETQLFQPMVQAAEVNLRAAGAPERIATVLADAGYWSTENAQLQGVEVLIVPDRARDVDRRRDVALKRTALLERLELGQISAADVAAELGVTPHRVSQLLRQRRRIDPPTITEIMLAKLATPRGQQLYSRRSTLVEPVFAQTKHNRKMRGFLRRGLAAVDSEWQLITATHNLLKLWRCPSGLAIA